MSDFTLGCPAHDVTTKLIVEIFFKPLQPRFTVQEQPELSFQLSSSSAKLSDLSAILNSLSDRSNVLGESDEERKEALSWMEKLKALSECSTSALNALDEHLRSRTFMIGTDLTAVDLLTYTSLHGYISTAAHQDLLKHPSVTRHFDHIQNLPSVLDAIRTETSIQIPIVNINVDDVPTTERKSTQSEKKEKKPRAPATDPVTSSPAVESTSQSNQQKQEKSEKQKGDSQKDKKKDKKPTADVKKPAPAPDGPPMPHMIDMRIGKILQVEKHPDADSLYVEKIDFGEPEPRTVVSGLVNYIPINEMNNRLLVGICNLKPANMRGIKSFAMVLAATSKDGKGGPGSVELVAPPPNSQPGDRVYFEGFEDQKPIEQLNSKKKQFETIQPNLTTLDNKDACWIDPSNDGKPHRIMTHRGVCQAPTFVGASLS